MSNHVYYDSIPIHGRKRGESERKMKLSDPLITLKGIGPETAKKFESLHIRTVADLLDHWPRRYEDYSKVTKVKDIRPGAATIKAYIRVISSRYSRKGLHVTEAAATDETGTLTLVWFNQPYRAGAIKGTEEYFISGNFDLNGQRLSMVNPALQEAKDIKDGGRILAVYPETKGVNSALIRRAVHVALPAARLIPETLPPWLVAEAGVIGRAEAVQFLHEPPRMEDLVSARKRLSFEEVFELQLGNQLVRHAVQEEKAPRIPFDEKIAKEFVDHLEFTLTDDQRKVIWRVYKDINKTSPANRLIEGDVGSGKTVVAAMAALMAMKAGYQVLYMAPTEILARQHAETLSHLFAHTEWSHQIGLLVGSLKKSQKTTIHNRIADGTCRLVIGTHALIQDSVAADNVGLVIIDEQHRFGVDQRQKLRSKAGFFPHVLCMTATPIPRSLALTLYGELDLSVIRAMPAGRKATETKVVPFAARHQLYQDIDDEIVKGRQVFVVCPLISDSAVLQVNAAESLYKELQTKQLKHRRIGLIHGSLKSDEKDQVMKDFVERNLDVLVATTVIEVGVNVPNASVMVIEGAERFGLAQIHQLRGRIGRGEYQGFCYLIPSQDVGMTKRLRAVESTNDGFKLAELDLELRGPGAIYGTRQSGALDLRIASLEDREQTANAKRLATMFIKKGENLVKYPLLNERVAHFQSLLKLN